MKELIAKEPEIKRLPLPDSGTVQAVCCAVWDLGLQSRHYADGDSVSHKIIIAWEISQLINDPESEFNGQPYMLRKEYTLSLGEKANLRKDLESWRGAPFTAEERKGFNVYSIYGANCLLGVKHEPDKRDNGKVYANVSAILPLPKGMEKIKPVRAENAEPPKWVQELQAKAVNPFGEEPFGPADF
jgi:hypothetical protein